MKVILILGAAVWANGPSPTMQRRCAHALSVWDADKDQIIMPCGGMGQHPPTEAAAMAQVLQARGVPSSQIICENKSTTTFENIHNARQLLAGHSIGVLTIVTDSYHCPRAWMVARALGLRPKMSCPSLKGTHMPTQIKQHLREAGAIPFYALKLIGHAWRGRNQR